jgi:hypothetical protein
MEKKEREEMGNEIMNRNRRKHYCLCERGERGGRERRGRTKLPKVAVVVYKSSLALAGGFSDNSSDGPDAGLAKINPSISAV